MNSDVWQPIIEKEAKRLDKEGNETRINLQKQKKTKVGKAGSSKLTKTEDGRLVMEISKKKELAEIRQNLWKLYGKANLRPSEKVPEGRKLKSDATRKSISKYFRKGGESEQSRRSSIKNTLELMHTCLDNITQNED